MRVCVDTAVERGPGAPGLQLLALFGCDRLVLSTATACARERRVGTLLAVVVLDLVGNLVQFQQDDFAVHRFVLRSSRNQLQWVLWVGYAAFRS